MQHLKNIIKGTLLLFLFAFVMQPTPVHAATGDPQISPTTRNIFQNQLCKGLNDLGTDYSKTVYKGRCTKNYTKESDQDAAAKSICSVYGKQHLKDQCNAYNDAIAPTSAPTGGGAGGGTSCDDSTQLCSSCAGGDTGSNCVNCTETSCSDSAADPSAKCSDDDSGFGCDLVKKYVNPAINLFSIMFGLIAIISIILGGIQYTTSEGDSQKVTKAKSRITNTIIAIVAYFFLFAFLQFLIPGGIFNK